MHRDSNDVTLSVVDDGSGIDPDIEKIHKPGHFGVDTMRERVELAGGSFRISPGPGGGTEVRAVIPVEPS